AADHARQLAAPVVDRPFPRSNESTHAHQLVVHGEVRTWPARAIDDELPAALGQEPVITARDQLRAVGKDDAIALFLRLPMRQDPSLDIAPIPTAPLRAVDLVTDHELGDRLRRTVGEKDGGGGIHTVGAAVLAAAR